jgi:hypothetical protein
MAPYVLVLAKTTHEGATYARRAKLTRGRYRVVSSAASIRNLRRAEVHILPSFDRRPDKHSILAELRYGKCEYFTVEMPPRPERPVEPVEPDPRYYARPFGKQLSREDSESMIDIVEQHAAAVDNATRDSDSEGVKDIAEASMERDVDMTEALESHRESIEVTPVGEHFFDEVQETTGDVELEDSIPELGAAPGDLVDPEQLDGEIKKRRRSKCKKCAMLHYSDDPCPVQTEELFD